MAEFQRGRPSGPPGDGEAYPPRRPGRPVLLGGVTLHVTAQASRTPVLQCVAHEFFTDHIVQVYTIQKNLN